jgi:hypothetical protein
MNFKQFQMGDLARAALHDGLILGLDCGLGKTICAYVWPILKVGAIRKDGKPLRPMCPAEPVLMVAAGDLHAQIIDEGLKHFGTFPTVIDSQEKFLELSTLSPAGRRQIAPGYYLTTYTQLSRNGVTPFPELDLQDPGGMLRRLNLKEADVEEFFQERGERYEKFYTRLDVTPESTLAELNSKWFRARKDANQYRQEELDEAYYLLKNFAPARQAGAGTSRPQAISLPALSLEQQTGVTRLFVEMAHHAMAHNIGESKYFPKTNRAVKCVYSPTLADLAQDSFAVVVADEGTKLKGEETIVGVGTRQMNPKHRLVLTGTPIKNRLPDVFRLAHWVTGGKHSAHPRFPFSDADRESFSEEFLVSERNLSAEERSESGRRFVKLTPQVCNIHRAWKLLCPIILRRRKEECGEEVVAMHRHVVRAPMGTAQAAAYKFHIEAQYKDKNGKPAMGAKLQALRICAANPASGLLERPASDGKTKGEPRSKYAYIPKLAGALSVIKDVIERKEQVIVFSAFHDSLDALSAHLHEAGVKHVICDGRMSPGKRGAAAAKFKKGPEGGIPVMLAGVEAMSEGHSFNLCSNVILMAYSWAFDKFLQAINRVWRLNSIRDVHVYPFICEGSIDRTLEANIQEKGDAAELVLDGHLLGDNPSEVNLAELLRIAEKEFAEMAAGGTLDERELVKEWPALRAQLGLAMRRWEGLSFEQPKMDKAPYYSAGRSLGH